MNIVSKYVRENQRYTKKQLSRLFMLDESETDKFVKDLKAYGVLKAVPNNTEQKTLTDLVADDILNVDESVDDNDCLYVFPYVGIITIGNRIIKSYPKYLPPSTEPDSEMKQIFKVLEKYANSEEQIVNLYNGIDDNRSFNILAVILYLLHDYYEYGLYDNSLELLELNGEGDIIWQRTIDEGFAVIYDNKPYYTELFTRRMVEDDQDYFKRLHECVLTMCSKQLQDAGLQELFDIEHICLTEELIEDFGDKEYILSRISSELNVQFNTHKQIVLKTLYAYISQNRKMLQENDGISMFGTTAFHAVWEKACSEVFGNKLDCEIGKLSLSVPLAPDYDRDKKLIDLIEKPTWIGVDTEEQSKDTLIPDIITIFRDNENDCFVIFDAKYYVLTLEKGKPLMGQPGIGDITKQYLYQLAYKKFIDDHGIKKVRNCFLMPTANDDVSIKGSVKLNMLSSLKLEDIQIRLIPAQMLYSCYLEHKLIPIDVLKL